MLLSAVTAWAMPWTPRGALGERLEACCEKDLCNNVLAGIVCSDNAVPSSATWMRFCCQISFTCANDEKKYHHHHHNHNHNHNHRRHHHHHQHNHFRHHLNHHHKHNYNHHNDQHCHYNHHHLCIAAAVYSFIFPFILPYFSLILHILVLIEFLFCSWKVSGRSFSQDTK